jgi:hypothetical protein
MQAVSSSILQSSQGIKEDIWNMCNPQPIIISGFQSLDGNILKNTQRLGSDFKVLKCLLMGQTYTHKF